MRRLGLLLGALVVPALPLGAPPAHAAAVVICVGPVPAGTPCTTTRATVPEAVAAATSPDTLIRVGPGVYPGGPYPLGSQVSIQGSGAGTGTSATALQLPAGSAGITLNGGAVSDLRVVISGHGSTGVTSSSGSIVDNLVVFGPGSTNSIGLVAAGGVVRDATVNVTGGSGNTAVRGEGGTIITESTWNGGATGYRQASGSDTVSRVTISQAATAVALDAGSLSIDDTVLDLGATGATGLLARPSSAAATVTANHLTVVGGAAAARGIVADSTDAGITLTLTNSLVRGPATSLASVGSGSLTVSNSGFQTQTTGVTDGGGNLPLNLDPRFVDPTGNYRLRADSPAVDKAAGSAAATDRTGQDRTVDGDGDGLPEPDMGAYELRDVTAPQTTFTSGPQGATNDNTPVFAFRSEAGAKFECRVDAGAWQPCASPVTTTPLADGRHGFSVRATDEVFNVEATPATRSFTVDTAVPNATITKKPPKRFYRLRIKFKFATNEPGATFQCMLDNRAWRKCQPTYRFNVKVGKHRLLVRAVDAAGNVDPTPARYKYKRLARRR